MQNNYIHIFDTTLRDGEQAPGCSMTSEEKLRVATQLERLGVDIIEAGFPISSEEDFQSVKKIAQKIKGCQIAGLCRASFKDIDRGWEAVRHSESPRIHTFIATSEIHLKYKLRKTREQVLEMISGAVKHARNYTDNVEFSLRGRDAHGYRLSLHRSRRGRALGSHNNQHSRHRRVHDSRGIRLYNPYLGEKRSESRRRHPERSLP